MVVEATNTDARLATGVEGLDLVLGGGLFRGSAYIVHGPPGAGKTIMANQVCFTQAAAGGRALYLSLLAESHDRMLQHLSGMRFVDRDRVPDSILYLSAHRSLEDEGIEGLLRMTLHEMRRSRPNLVVLDGLFVARSAAGEEHAFRRFVHELQGQAAILDCTMLLLTNEVRDPHSPEHTMVDGWIELMDELRGARAVRSLVVRKQRGGPLLRGRHTFRITDDGLRVFPRLEALARNDLVAPVEPGRLPTGIEGLDRMTGGGYPAGSATVVAGPTGAGKTTLALHFLACCRPEERGLFLGLHETPARLRAKARNLGIDIDALTDRGAVELAWHAPGEALPDELGHRVLELVDRGGFRRIAFDGLKALSQAFVFRDRMTGFVNALNNILKSRSASILYTMELADLHRPTRIASIDLSSIVDNLILVHYGQDLDVVQREMVILKMRDSDFDPLREPFHITARGVHFGPHPLEGMRPGPEEAR